MANAIQTLAERYDSKESAAERFGRTPAWLNQATAAANLSPKVTALLDSGKISSTGVAVQLEKQAQKNEAKADTLIVQIESLPEGEKLAKKVVDHALSEAGGRPKKKNLAAPETVSTSAPVVSASNAGIASVAPWETPPDEPAAQPIRRLNSGKVKMVAKILGLADGDEEDVLSRLIDEFLAMNEGDRSVI